MQHHVICCACTVGIHLVCIIQPDLVRQAAREVVDEGLQGEGKVSVFGVRVF
jgi:hypothetical protein